MLIPSFPKDRKCLNLKVSRKVARTSTEAAIIRPLIWRFDHEDIYGKSRDH